MKKVIAFILTLAICFPIGLGIQQNVYAAEDTAGIVPSFVGVASLNPVFRNETVQYSKMCCTRKIKNRIRCNNYV